MEEKDKLQELLDSAKEMAGEAGKQLNQLGEEVGEKIAPVLEAAEEKFGQLKEAAGEKLAEWSDKAEQMAAEARAEAAAKAAELQAAKEKIAAHEGGALGFLSDKAKELVGDSDPAEPPAAEEPDERKSFWDKARDFVSDKD